MNARLLGPGNRGNGVVVANLAKQANLTATRNKSNRKKYAEEAIERTAVVNALYM